VVNFADSLGEMSSYPRGEIIFSNKNEKLSTRVGGNIGSDFLLIVTDRYESLLIGLRINI